MFRVLKQLILVLTLVWSFPAWAEVSFSNIDIDQNSRMLFQAHADAPGYGAYKTVFSADTASLALTQLSFYPENVIWLPKTRELQIQNRFGVFRTAAPFKNPALLAKFPGFTTGAEIQEGKLNVVQASPDGSWLVYQRSTSSAFAELALHDVRDGTERLLSSKVELTLEGPAVKWSPASDVIIYERDQTLFYYPVAQARNGRMLDESLRRIGKGNIHSVEWGVDGQLYYVSGTMVYEILSAELFTRSLYQDFMKIGRIIGRLPHTYEPNFDSFYMSPDGATLMLSKNGMHVYVYAMDEENGNAGKPEELPFLHLPRSTRLLQVVWSAENIVTLLMEHRSDSNVMSGLFYRLDLNKKPLRFEASETRRVRSMVKNDNRVALLFDDSVELWDYSAWKKISGWSHPKPLWVVFTEQDKLLVAGNNYAEQISIAADTEREFLFFTQADSYGFDTETGLATLKSEDRSYSRDKDFWIARSPFRVRQAMTANDTVRAYPENLYSGPYKNIVMMRKVKELGTRALFNAPSTAYEAFPLKDEPIDTQHFTNGSRIRERQVALTFNAIDSSEGLSTILSVLSYYGIRATFFINGEFIRRYPSAVKEIAASGQEVGSLFYMYFNLADSRYQLSTDFIKQGLARNEDEYFELTGKELTLLWRSPYYVVNKQILEASKDLKYILVGRDVDSLDYIAKDSNTSADLYAPASVLAEQVLEDKKPGSVISLSIGKPGEYLGSVLYRDDYLFQKLDVLINGLLQKGYKIVPVSTLIESAR